MESCGKVNLAQSAQSAQGFAPLAPYKRERKKLIFARVGVENDAPIAPIAPRSWPKLTYPFVLDRENGEIARNLASSDSADACLSGNKVHIYYHSHIRNIAVVRWTYFTFVRINKCERKVNIREKTLTQALAKKSPGGRPKGSVNQRTKAIRAVANKAIEEGVTPIEVMLDNMRFYHEKAAVLQTAVLAKVSKISLKSEEALELLKDFKDMGANRLKAQACAVDAGPYVHPRLSATQADVKVTHSVEAEEAFKTIANALDGAVYGEIIDHEPVEVKKKVKA